MNATGQSDRGEIDRDTVDDQRLVARAANGDADALRVLMERYDRLVRFAIFRLSRDRCLRDPQWLDGLASEIWTAFVQRARQSPDAVESARALLLSIARNRTVSALRSAIRERAQGPASARPTDDADVPASDTDAPTALFARMEDLSALQTCRDTLSADDRRMMTQLEAILDRRWEAAAKALGMPESTLRSRWKGVLDHLRRCMETKTGRDFAPTAPSRDS